jgi:hypothetical protein
VDALRGLPLVLLLLGDCTHLAIAGSLIFARRIVVASRRRRVRWRKVVARTRITMGGTT